MIVRLTRDALADLEHIKNYFTDIDAALAERVLTHAHRTLRLLSSWPHLGSPGHRDGTREVLLPRLPYVIVYRIDLGTQDELVILRVLHVRQVR